MDFYGVASTPADNRGWGCVKNKHKVAISTSMSHMGDPNKHKSVRSISNCISSLYKCMKILISVIIIRLL